MIYWLEMLASDYPDHECTIDLTTREHRTMKTTREIEVQKQSHDLRENLNAHGLTIKAVVKANGITSSTLKKYWEKKLHHNLVACVLIDGCIAVAKGSAQQELINQVIADIDLESDFGK
jgi:hypothetical protein